MTGAPLPLGSPPVLAHRARPGHARRRLHGRDLTGRHPGGSQRTDGGRTLAGHVARGRWSSSSSQAFRFIIPPLTNELVLLTKDSSLVSILGIAARKELTKFGREALNPL